MSKIGKKPIQVPKGVEVKINGNSVALKGSKGELKKDFDQTIDISMNGDEIVLKLKKETKDKKILALWGLTRSLIANMIIGVAEGFEKGLEFEDLVKPHRASIFLS